MVEFVSYTGAYPNFCSGVLTLRIDGEEVRFGHDYIFESRETDGNYDAFWVTGGTCGFYANGEDYINHDEWQLIESNLPEKYEPYSEELINVFNDNVRWGCCGGCL